MCGCLFPRFPARQSDSFLNLVFTHQSFSCMRFPHPRYGLFSWNRVLASIVSCTVIQELFRDDYVAGSSNSKTDVFAANPALSITPQHKAWDLVQWPTRIGPGLSGRLSHISVGIVKEMFLITTPSSTLHSRSAIFVSESTRNA